MSATLGASPGADRYPQHNVNIRTSTKVWHVLLFVAMPAWSATPTGEAKFLAADGATGDQFGYSVALSGDTAVIGARFAGDDVNGLESGSAYVFTRSGTIWRQQAKLTAPDGEARDWFGVRVAISVITAVSPEMATRMTTMSTVSIQVRRMCSTGPGRPGACKPNSPPAMVHRWTCSATA